MTHGLLFSFRRDRWRSRRFLAGIGAAAVTLPLLAITTPVAARTEIVPTITAPSGNTPEVPGGWTGPIEANFAQVSSGDYTVSVGCDTGYWVEYTHSIPDGGDRFSTAIPALPQDAGCGVVIVPSDDSNSYLATKDFIATKKVFTFDDLEPSETRFFPRRQDGYYDQLRLDYWLTQPARVAADIVNSKGQTVTTLQINHRRSGANRLTWDGKLANGKVPRQGRYRARLTATNLDGLSQRASTAFVLSDLLTVKPGRIGAARAGMSIKQAMATGQFNRNVRYTVPGVCSRTYPLQPKEPLTFDYSVFVQRKRITEITTNTPGVRLPKRLSFPPTAAQVRRAYSGRVRTGTAGYANNALFVRTGRKWLAFTFDSYSYNRELRPDDKALSFSVAIGRRPTGRQYDGC